ncbi:hypothetical protein HU200_007471 [Digitaria exilis]|uniref:Small auxin up regulated protein n=1 Tax=Digitaria exilis TaxID=1010633 RepID=A0A835KRA2_9POAL|nr:hypothetical protein HU200_007471 [Digitaria exilis]
MKMAATQQLQQPHEADQDASRAHLLAGAPSRHDATAAAAATKGRVMFVVEGNRVAVPVACLRHPRMLELLEEAKEEYEYEHEGAIVLPCGFDRFKRAASAAGHGHGHGHGHHHFRLPHIHIARCFRPSHVVA